MKIELHAYLKFEPLWTYTNLLFRWHFFHYSGVQASGSRMEDNVVSIVEDVLSIFTRRG